jgi:hypothetical protein
MGLFRKTPVSLTPPPARTADHAAVERYEYLLRTAPPDTIESAHAEAFEKLTPAQLDILFERFTENAPTPAERPRDARPATLARTATRVEAQKPGTMSRLFGANSGSAASPYFAGSILDGIAGYVIGTAIASAFFPIDYGTGGDANAHADTTAETNADVPAQESIDQYYLDDFGF